MSKKQKVVYVDDEDINLLLFESNFEDKYEVLTATDGYKGLKVLDDNPDAMVVISDMKMPGMNGLEFIRSAKDKFPNKKFYILSGFDISDGIKAALDDGLILEYFRKPFDVRKMHKIITDSLKN